MGRAPCCDKANVRRGPWSPEEDATLKSYVETHGTGGNWIALPKKAGISSLTSFIFICNFCTPIFINIEAFLERSRDAFLSTICSLSSTHERKMPTFQYICMS